MQAPIIGVARIFAAGGGCTLFLPQMLTTFVVVVVLTIYNTPYNP